MPFDPRRPFTSATARAAGLTRAELRGPRFRSVLRGVHVSAEVESSLRLRVEAALLVHPVGAVVSHHTAAALQELPVPYDESVHVTVRRAADRRGRPGLLSHVGAPTHTVHVGRAEVATGVSLFLQLAEVLGLVDLVVLGDAMVRRGLVSLHDLRRAAGQDSHAARAAGHVRERVDSPMESRVRLLLELAGFPEPVVNAVVETGRGSYRPDLCWPALRLVVEYDGRHHRADLDQWDHDLVRREWFEAHGWTMVVLVARDLYQRPDEVVRRVHEAWLRCGGAPFRPSDAWRPYFPARRSVA